MIENYTLILYNNELVDISVRKKSYNYNKIFEIAKE